jgi:hypothetical protein
MKDYVEIGGAKSSDFAPRYDQIPASALRRIAQRFSKGNTKFDGPEAAYLGGEMNWQKGDASYFRERFNHVIQHLNNWKESFEQGVVTYSRQYDDDLAAAVWGIMALMWAEDNDKIQPVYEGPDAEPLPDTFGLNLPDAQDIQGKHIEVESSTDKVLSFFGLKR